MAWEVRKLQVLNVATQLRPLKHAVPLPGTRVYAPSRPSRSPSSYPPTVSLVGPNYSLGVNCCRWLWVGLLFPDSLHLKDLVGHL